MMGRIYAVEMDLGAMIYIPGFVNVGSDILNLVEGGISLTHTHTYTHRKVIS
jgi:hypothetical protein